MKQTLDYGGVFVTAGKYKGRIGYYDDDGRTKAVVYLDHFFDGWVEIQHKYLQQLAPEITDLVLKRMWAGCDKRRT